MYAKLWVLTHTFCGAVPSGAEKVRCPKMHFETKNVYPAPAGPPAFRDLKKSIPSFFVLCYNAFLASVLVRRTQNAGEDAIKDIGIRKEETHYETQHHEPSVQPGCRRPDRCELLCPDRLRQQRIFHCFFHRFHHCFRSCRRRQHLRRERDLDPGRWHPDHQRHRPYDRLQRQLSRSLGRSGR